MYLQDLSTALAQNTQLTELKLAGCGIGNAGVSQLAKVLPAQVQMLSLEHNCIGNSAAAELGMALQKPNRLLCILDLTSNQIGDVGVTALAKGLSSCKSLSELSLSSNCLDDCGTVQLCSALHGCSALKALDLSNNAIGDIGCEAVSLLLNQVDTVQQVDLSVNAITGGAINKLEQDIAGCPNELKVNLAWNIVLYSKVTSTEERRQSISSLGVHHQCARYSRLKSARSRSGEAPATNKEGHLQDEFLDHDEDEDEDEGTIQVEVDRDAALGSLRGDGKGTIQDAEQFKAGVETKLSKN